MRKRLLTTWRQREWNFHASSLFPQPTYWTSCQKGIVPKRYMLKNTTVFPFPLFFLKRMYALVKPYNCIIWLNVVISFLSQVAVHLSKLFDNMSDLDFSNSEELDNPKGAVGMYSKEREYVPFLAQCRCEGPVRLCGKTKVMFVSFFY